VGGVCVGGCVGGVVRFFVVVMEVGVVVLVDLLPC